VTVNQPSASAAELAQMGSLSVYGTYYGDTNQVDFLELPLVNKGDYAYTGPPNLEMVYRHSSHSASVDSAQLRQVLGTLNSSGQMINGFSFVSFDTVHRIDPNREEFYSKLISVIADTLSIEYKTTDSVAFVSPTRVGVHALNIDRSSQTPSTDPCPGIDPIEILPRLGPVSFVVDRLKLVWRR
jgi:hypothetical protein